MFEASHLQYKIVSGYIQIVSDGHYLPAFWSHPDVGGTFPGLVMLHEQWGLTAHVRAQARRFAEQGYYVIAPDLFNRQTASTEAEAAALVDELGEAGLARVAAALHALATHNRCNGKIGVIGWDFGASLALETAVLRDDLRAVVCFYGLPPDFKPAGLLMLECPLLALFGADDPAIPPDSVARLQAAAGQAAHPHEIVVFPGVGAGFFNDTLPTFEPEVAATSWQRVLTFLNDRLDPGDPPKPGSFEPGTVY